MTMTYKKLGKQRKRLLGCCLFRYRTDGRLVLCRRKAKLRVVEVLQARFTCGLGTMLKNCFLPNQRLPICDVCLGLDKD